MCIHHWWLIILSVCYKTIVMLTAWPTVAVQLLWLNHMYTQANSWSRLRSHYKAACSGGSRGGLNRRAPPLNFDRLWVFFFSFVSECFKIRLRWHERASKTLPGSLTLIRLGYFGGWKDWGGGPWWPPLEISAVDRAIAAKISTMVVCDVIYKIAYLDFPKYFYFILY